MSTLLQVARPMNPSDEVADACADLAEYLTRLAPLTAVAASTGPADPVGGGGKVTGSPAPWNTAAANAITTALEGIRRLEASMRRDITGQLGGRRGGSDGNTTAALQAIPKLAAGLPADQAGLAASILSRWVDAARAVPGIDEATRWRPLPKTPGERLPPRCRYCGCYQLRADLDAGVVACFVPGCRTPDGNHPVAFMDTNAAGQPCLTWADGHVQTVPILEVGR